MIVKLCGIAVLGATVAVLLGELGFKSRRIFSLLVAVLLISFVGEGLSSVISSLTEISEAAGITKTFLCALKILFVGYLFGISSDMCAELGESGIASALTLVGRVETFVLVLPSINEILRLGMELVG